MYNPIPMLYYKLSDNPKYDNQTYAWNGGLSLIGNKITVFSEDHPSKIYVGFDEHRFVYLTEIYVTRSAQSETMYAE